MRPLSSPPTLGGAVAEHLRTAIVAGEIPPGQLLKESELAQRLGVSATPIRERSEEHTSELQSLMRISYAVFCLKKKMINTLYNDIASIHNRQRQLTDTDHHMH